MLPEYRAGDYVTPFAGSERKPFIIRSTVGHRGQTDLLDREEKSGSLHHSVCTVAISLYCVWRSAIAAEAFLSPVREKYLINFTFAPDEILNSRSGKYRCRI
jgi:hypothetical protein